MTTTGAAQVSSPNFPKILTPADRMQDRRETTLLDALRTFRSNEYDDPFGRI